jgi:hypothetical protein
LGAYDAVLDQWLEYFGKKGRSDILRLADILFENDLPGRLAGHIKNGTDCVFCRSSNNQGNSLLQIFLTRFVIKVIVLNDYVNLLSGYLLILVSVSLLHLTVAYGFGCKKGFIL